MENDAMPEEDDETDYAAMEATVLQSEKDVWPEPPHPLPDVVQVFVGNLNKSSTSHDILALTSNYGIGSVLVTWPNNKQRKFAFITILESDLGKALLMHGIDFKGQKLTVRPPGRRVCFCKFSISEEGRCNVDAEAPLDDSDPFCPFGKHYCEINDTTTSASAAAVGQSSKSPEELLREEQRKNMIAEEKAVARQRKMAVDTELVNEQNEKCHIPLRYT
eukprot:scaffold30847_cov66-Skeletonema_dohrnii-CCMP3373.AAC.1